MKLMVISLSLIFLLQFAAALNIDFESPSEIGIDEEFTVKIEADSTETFDVKIFVHTSEDKKISRGEYSSEIMADDWQSSWNYINEAFPEEKTYKVKVVESPGERTICVRLRKSDTKTTNIECKTIEVIEPEQIKEESTEEIEEEPIENLELEKAEVEEQVPEKISYQNEKIILISESQSNSKQETHTTKTGFFRYWLIYGFTGLCVLIIILFSLRRL